MGVPKKGYFYKYFLIIVLTLSLSLYKAEAVETTNQTITGTIGVVLSLELRDAENNVVSNNLGFGDLVFDGTTNNTLQTSVRVSTNSGSGLRLLIRGNHGYMFKDDDLDNSHDSGEEVIPNRLRVEASSSGVFSQNISERDITTTNAEIGRSTEVTTDVNVPLTYKVVIPENQIAGVYKMLVTLSVANN
jgi:hypothetical protein